MLDQNTDRLWYVIGSVLIGAAIILLLNGTVPDLFAQVAGTYEEKTGEATNAIEYLSPRPANLLNNYDLTWNRWPYVENGELSIREFEESFITEEISVEPSTTLELVPANYTPENSSPTIAVVEYDENGEFIRRNVHREMTPVPYTVGEDTHSIQVSAKSYNGQLNGHAVYIKEKGSDE